MDFKPTDDQRFSVSVMAGSGSMSHEEIALTIGVSLSDLRTHFAAELTTGAYRRRQEVIEAQYKAAMKGSVSAQKAYLAKTPKAAAPPLPKPTKAEKDIGKKAQAQADAVTAQTGTEWETLLTPPASVN